MAIREVLVLGHTHHDVGYTNSPRIVDAMHPRIVSEVLDLCEQRSSEGPAQFRWTFEAARPVINFLRGASQTDRARLATLTEDGRISVTGGYLNMTQLPNESEIDSSYALLSKIRSAGIAVRTVQHGDVNGISWGTVPAMQRSGLSRLVMALNPDHGRAPFEQPTGFWWEGPDGCPIFVWLSTHYGFGEEWGIVDGDVEKAERAICGFLDRLNERSDYPYETAVVHAGNDNRWPTPLFLDVVTYWNQKHPELSMRTATIDDALDVLMKQAHQHTIPTVRGEWADWWSHGHGSTAREVAVYRRARSFALAAQGSLALSTLRQGGGDTALSTVLGYRRGPVRLRTPQEIQKDQAGVEEQLLLFDEHTWGAWETYSKPHSDFNHSHWNAKASYAYGAYDMARDLAVEGLFRLMASGRNELQATTTGSRSIAVVNASERSRTEPVTVEVDGAELLTVVASAPAFGTAVLPIPGGKPTMETGRSISNQTYEVVVDPHLGGVTSLRDLRSGRELVDPESIHGLGAVVVQQIADFDHPMMSVSPKHFRPEDPGPDFNQVGGTGDEEPVITRAAQYTAVTWRSSAPGVPSIETTLRIYEDTDLVDVDVSLTKPEAAGPESIFVTFPFLVQSPIFLLETAGAVFRAESEQLPDSCRDWYSIQHAVGVQGASHGMLWGAFDAPLVQLGSFHTGEWAERLDARRGHINSWLMNNLHFTNFQARQEGTGTYRYRFLPQSDGDDLRQRVRVFGRSILQPLQARQYDGPARLNGASGLTVEPADQVLADLRLVDDDVRVRLRNITADDVVAALRWDSGEIPVRQVALSAHATEEVSLSAVSGK